MDGISGMLFEEEVIYSPPVLLRLFLSLRIKFQNIGHAREMAAAGGAVKSERVRIEPEMHGRLAARFDDMGVLPKFVIGIDLGRVGWRCPNFTAFFHRFDVAARIMLYIVSCHSPLPSMP